jgi:hypothetical protein
MPESWRANNSNPMEDLACGLEAVKKMDAVDCGPGPYEIALMGSMAAEGLASSSSYSISDIEEGIRPTRSEVNRPEMIGPELASAMTKVLNDISNRVGDIIARETDLEILGKDGLHPSKPSNTSMIDIEITGHCLPTLTLTEDQARALVRALSQLLDEPSVCGLRGTCALYPQNKVAYHDEGAADPSVVVTKREDDVKVLTVSSVEDAARLYGVGSEIHLGAKTLFGTTKMEE